MVFPLALSLQSTPAAVTMRFQLQPAQVLVNINNNNNQNQHQRRVSSIDVDRLDNELAHSLRSTTSNTNQIYDNDFLAVALNGNLNGEQQDSYNFGRFIATTTTNEEILVAANNSTGLKERRVGVRSQTGGINYQPAEDEEQNGNEGYFEDCNRTNVIYNEVKLILHFQQIIINVLVFIHVVGLVRTRTPKLSSLPSEIHSISNAFHS